MSLRNENEKIHLVKRLLIKSDIFIESGKIYYPKVLLVCVTMSFHDQKCCKVPLISLYLSPSQSKKSAQSICDFRGVIMLQSSFLSLLDLCSFLLSMPVSFASIFSVFTNGHN